MTGFGKTPVLLSGSSNRNLAQAVADELELPLADAQITQFPDGELNVRVSEDIRGERAVILQSTHAPAERHLLELCLLSDACRRAGVDQLTAIVPYFGYARHDRRVHEGEPIAVRVVTDIMAAARIDRLVSLDVHCPAIETISSMSCEHLTAFPQLLLALRAHGIPDPVVVAPDLGAAKLADHVGRALNAPVALVHKLRLSGERVQAGALAGDVRGRSPIIVD